MRARRRAVGLGLSVAVVLLVASGGFPEEGLPQISNLRVDGLRLRDGTFVALADVGKEYRILIDVKSTAPILYVLVQRRWPDGRFDAVAQRPFQLTPPGALKGLLTIRARVPEAPMAREVYWWVEDSEGRTSNKLVQRLAIRE